MDFNKSEIKEILENLHDEMGETIDSWWFICALLLVFFGTAEFPKTEENETV